MLITYTLNLVDIDWREMKEAVAADNFDNGRSWEQLQSAFKNSHSACIAHGDGKIIGTARVLSDGVCNAYLLDVWTMTDFRRRGVARTMITMLLEQLHGQHIYLFTDDAVEFYEKLGFVPRPTGLEKVVGKWLTGKSEVVSSKAPKPCPTA